MLHTVMLNQNKDFLALYKRGVCIPLRYVVLYVRRNRCGFNRLGVTAGKKIGNAVCRNRAKRLIRQAYRETEALLPCGMDLVIVARASVLQIKSPELTALLAGKGLRQLQAAVPGDPQKQ